MGAFSLFFKDILFFTPLKYVIGALVLFNKMEHFWGTLGESIAFNLFFSCRNLIKLA